MATTESIIAGGGGDYTTIQGWADAHASTTLSDEQIGEIQDNSTYDENITFTGITSSASNFMRLSVAAANRPKGVAGGGAKLHPTGTGHAITTTNCNYLVVEHLEIHPGTASSDECFRIGSANQTIQYCLCVGRGQDTTPYQQDGIYVQSLNATVNVYNTIFQNFSRAAIDVFYPTGSETLTLNVFNCSILNCGLDEATGTDTDRLRNGGIAITCQSGCTTNLNVKNTISMDNLYSSGDAPGDFGEHTTGGTISWSGTGNIASDATATAKLGSTNNLNSASTTTNTSPGAGTWVVFTNITNGSENLHLQASSSNEAQNEYSSISFADTTATFTDDIDGDTRTAALMDGGADQITTGSVEDTTIAAWLIQNA